ncbi:MAG TPA: hypothetical protein VKG92_04810 [Flavobacteriales bacterium]|nr:hypothetical protein [Flavobacteriales bacterium]
MSKASSASVTTTDPGYPNDKTAVTKSTTKAGPGDTVSVNPDEDGTNAGRNVVVVFSVNANARATATADANSGVVTLTASGSGTAQYLVVTLNSSDPANWTVYVNTSGGTNYTFTKGNGGGGY